jgi:hypothetical protein
MWKMTQTRSRRPTRQSRLSQKASEGGMRGHSLGPWWATTAERDKLPDDEDAQKPTMNAALGVLELADELRAAGRPGWLRSGADLLALSGEAQVKILSAIRASTRASHRDGSYHDAMTAYAGLWGYATIFIASCPSSIDVSDAKERLLRYASAKQYQLQADRAYGWVFDESGSLQDSFYLSTVSANDPDLDALVMALQLQPTAKRPTVIPPSAKRSTRRLKQGNRR